MIEVVREYRGALEPVGAFVRSASGLVKAIREREERKGSLDHHNSRVLVIATRAELAAVGAKENPRTGLWYVRQPLHRTFHVALSDED